MATVHVCSAPDLENPDPEDFAPSPQMHAHAADPLGRTRGHQQRRAVPGLRRSTLRHRRDHCPSMRVVYSSNSDIVREKCMPEFDYEEMKKEAAQYIRFEKDRKNRIATITFDRPDAQNADDARNAPALCRSDPQVQRRRRRQGRRNSRRGRGFRQRRRPPRAARHDRESRHAFAARTRDQRR